jgi:hypothetical protein
MLSPQFSSLLLTIKMSPPLPRINEALRQAACPSGFLNRKNDGEPGVKIIWLGRKNVHVAV